MTTPLGTTTEEKRLDERDVALGKAIKRVRRAMNCSQADLANAIGLKRPSIPNIEAGRQSVKWSQLVDIATFLEIPLTELVFPSEVLVQAVEDRKQRQSKVAELEDRINQLQREVTRLGIGSIRLGDNS